LDLNSTTNKTSITTPDGGAHAGVAARFAALGLIEAVVARGRPLDEAVDQASALDKLEPRDRAFAHALAAATIRAWGFLQCVVDACLARPDGHLPDRLRMILALGAAQLLILNVPPHAAVGATVDLADGALVRLRGLTNALLRRMDRERETLLKQFNRPRNSTPDWLWAGWAQAYGEAVTNEIAAAHQLEPPLDLTLKPGLDPLDWAQRLGAQVMPTGSLRLAHGGRVADLPGYADGAWWVQDAAAALPARLLGAGEGDSVIDLCAAPGGKTAQLAALGARVTAVDQARGRMERLEGNLARLGLSATCVVADVATWRPAARVPYVLLDAPCSATGTLRRNPDIALHRDAEEVRALAKVQGRLFRAAVEMLAPGGTLVVCTCSIEPREGPEMVDAMLAAGAPLKRRPIGQDEVPGLAEAITPAGDLRTLPSHWAQAGGIDGFFISRLTRS
jgi:16S rRNA (cytosine967-C5)-methyltransferase